MSTEQPDPAEAIAQALSRLRGRRPHGRGHGGPHGGPADLVGGLHGHGDAHERHPHGRRAFDAPPWAGARLGGPAWMRMLDALASASDPLSVSALGEAIGVDQPRASRLVQQGVQRGLVVRELDPDDARRTRIALTDTGRKMTRGMRGERREMLATALESFTDDERRELARLLGKLADNWNG